MVREDIDKLRSGQHVVIGTPGRVYDMVSKLHLRVDDLVACMLVDADDLMSRGFKDQVLDLINLLPACRQLCLFSPTLQPNDKDFFSHLMRNPRLIHVTSSNRLSVSKVRQFYVAIEKDEWKLDTLCDLYETLTLKHAIVYCNARRTLDFLTNELQKRDFAVCAGTPRLTTRRPLAPCRNSILAQHICCSPRTHTIHASKNCGHVHA